MSDYVRTTNLEETMEVLTIFKSLGYAWFDGADPVSGKKLADRVYYFKNCNRFEGRSFCPNGKTWIEAKDFISMHGALHATRAPIIGTRYWTVLPGLGVMSTEWEGSVKDKLRLEFNNVFLQESLAQKASERNETQKRKTGARIRKEIV